MLASFPFQTREAQASPPAPSDRIGPSGATLALTISAYGGWKGRKLVHDYRCGGRVEVAPVLAVVAFRNMAKVTSRVGTLPA